MNGELVWYRDDDKWKVASKEVDHIGRPLQQHPVFKGKRRLDGLEWKAHTIWNTKKRKLDELNGTPNFPQDKNNLIFCFLVVGVSNSNAVELSTMYAGIPYRASRNGSEISYPMNNLNLGIFSFQVINFIMC